jgi:hypothetical protein
MNDHRQAVGAAENSRNFKHIHSAIFGHGRSENLPLPVKFLLEYDLRDPFAVSFSLASGPTKWTFARELLATGLQHWSGEGQVRVGPLPTVSNVTLVELNSPGGRAVFKSPTWQLQDFLSCTCEIVPRGQEHLCLSVDSALSELLAEEQT